jgi:hypothetical protein
MEGQVGAPALAFQPTGQRIIDPDCTRDRVEVGAVPPNDVDPQKLPLVELASETGRQLDIAIPAIRVVESRANAASVGLRGTQRVTASRVTTTSATSAIPYCRTFMARSPRPPRPPLAAPTGTPLTTGLTIDLLSS